MLIYFSMTKYKMYLTFIEMISPINYTLWSSLFLVWCCEDYWISSESWSFEELWTPTAKEFHTRKNHKSSTYMFLVLG